MTEFAETRSSSRGRYDFVMSEVPTAWDMRQPTLTYHVMAWDDTPRSGKPYDNVYIGMYVDRKDGSPITASSYVPLEDAETFAYAILAAVHNGREFQAKQTPPTPEIKE